MQTAMFTKHVKIGLIYSIVSMIIATIVFIADYCINDSTDSYTIDDITCTRGIYDIYVEYDTDGFGRITVTGGEDQPLWYVRSSYVPLVPYSNSVHSTVYANGWKTNFTVNISADEDSVVQLRSVIISRKHLQSAAYLSIHTLFLLIIAGITASAVIGIYHCNFRYNARIIFLISFIVAISSFGFLMSYIPGGHDVNFHLARIAAIADGLKTGHFPVRMYPYFATSYGYPLGIMYGDFFLYPFALLHMAGFPLWKTYVFYVVFINFLTAVISYHVFRHISGDDIVALMGCGIYTLSVWRLDDIYIRAAVGEYTAMAFLPLIILAVYTILTSEANDDNRKTVIKCLVTGYTGLILCHVLSCIMVTLCIVVVCLIFCKKILRNGYGFTIIRSVMITALLTAGFTVPFTDYYLSHDFAVKNQEMMIQSDGAYLSQIFALSGNYAQTSASITDQIGIANDMPLNIGIVMVVILLGSIIYIVDSSENNRSMITVLTALSGLYIWMSTCYFPYDTIAKYGGIFAKIICAVQFPWRYLTIATVLLSLSAVIILNKLKGRHYYHTVIAILATLTLFSSMSVISDTITSNDHDIYPMDADQIISSSFVKDLLYFIDGTHVEELWNTDIFIYNDGLIAEATEDAQEKNGAGTYTLYVKNISGKDEYIDLPVTNYKGYNAEDENGNEITISDGYNHRIRVSIPADFDGKIDVDFREPWYWRVAELLSFITIIFLLVKRPLQYQRISRQQS